MNHSIKLACGLLLLLLCSNAAMPGFFNVGGGGAFVPFFAEDTLHQRKIEMAQERITVLLHPGFAVVKGEYWMRNRSADTVSMQVGYPINGTMNNSFVYAVNFNDIEKLKVLINGRETRPKRLPAKDGKPVNPLPMFNQPENWYAWPLRFAPDTLTHLTVYFMVNTNQAYLREGYSRDIHNGFCYVLESGRAWAQTIGKGEIRIQLAPDLAPEQIIGLAPNAKFRFHPEKKYLYWRFKNLEPGPADNVLLRYGKRQEGFDYEAHVAKAPQYYQALDQLSEAAVPATGFVSFVANDFEIHDWKSATWFYGFMFLAIFGLPLLLIFLGGLMLVHFFRKKSKKSPPSV
ncbi:MAG: hypothetical protein OHK0053_02390 [Microscillaceae bacterium]